MKKLIEQHLGLSNVSITKIETHAKGHIEITVKSTLKGTRCHCCHQEITKFYDYDRPLKLRHLSILDQPVYILMRFPRYQCEHCDKNPKTTQRPEWHKKNSSFTKPYEEHIVLCAINSTEKDVSCQEGITAEQVQGIVNRHIDAEVDWSKIEELPDLGIDEISLRKGHQSFIVVISSIINGKQHIIALLKGRKKATVKQFLSSIPERLKSTVRWVCSDMYEGYINAAKEIFGKKTRIVIDRFHVAKLYRSKVDTLRKKELKRLKKCLSVSEYKKLKGAMWALRRAPANLSDEEKRILDTVFYHSEALDSAYDYSKKLTEIFNDSVSRASGVRRLKSWIKSVEASSLDCFSGFIKTLKKHFDEIANYFVSHKSSGFVEGLNNKIKVVKRRCYGIFRLDHLFQRIFLDLQGYTLFK
jgi:transposase